LLQLFLKKGTWLLEEIALPHFYRSEGYSTVFRQLDMHHMLISVLQQHGECAGFYPLWRSQDMRPFSRDDIRFMELASPHIAHGLNAAYVTSAGGVRSCSEFAPNAAEPGVVLMQRDGRVLAMDAQARSMFLRLNVFDERFDQIASNRIAGALGRITRTMQEIFWNRSGPSLATSPPFETVYSHWTGVTLKLRGVLLDGDPNQKYFMVLVQTGDLKHYLRQKVTYRWGFTSRELEIIRGLAFERQRTEIASSLDIAPETLKIYLRRLADKVGVNGVSDLRRFAREQRLSF
jgi:DNA-binding CsgD family transcriptional regulator